MTVIHIYFLSTALSNEKICVCHIARHTPYELPKISVCVTLGEELETWLLMEVTSLEKFE